MMNTSEVSYFTLGGYFDPGLLKYFYFIFTLSLYILIVGSNVLLIVVISVNRSLHEPMYMFLCSLFVNELYGSLGLFPFLLIQILSDVHTVSAPLCFLQLFIVHSYGAVEFLNLAVMSYDRYLAICYPLQYISRMTPKKIAILISVTWLYPFLGLVVSLFLITPLQLNGNRINKVYCDMHSIVKLACSDTTLINIYGLIATFGTISVALFLILYTYFQIFLVCFSGSKQTRQKAVSTCTPHLISLVNFSFGCLFETLQSRFDMSSLPHVLRLTLSLYFLMLQPLLNPIVYGMQMSKIRNSWKGFLQKKILA